MVWRLPQDRDRVLSIHPSDPSCQTRRSRHQAFRYRKWFAATIELVRESAGEGERGEGDGRGRESPRIIGRDYKNGDSGDG